MQSLPAHSPAVRVRVRVGVRVRVRVRVTVRVRVRVRVRVHLVASTGEIPYEFLGLVQFSSSGLVSLGLACHILIHRVHLLGQILHLWGQG